MALIQKVAPTMRIMKMFADCRIFSTNQTKWKNFEQNILFVTFVYHLRDPKALHYLFKEMNKEMICLAGSFSLVYWWSLVYKSTNSNFHLNWWPSGAYLGNYSEV